MSHISSDTGERIYSDLEERDIDDHRIALERIKQFRERMDNELVTFSKEALRYGNIELAPSTIIDESKAALEIIFDLLFGDAVRFHTNALEDL